MAEFGNLGSDSDSNEDIDHIPKTPGPLVMSDGEQSEDEKSGDEHSVERNKSSDSDAADSDSSDEHNSANDSEVERSDNENDDNNDGNDDNNDGNDDNNDGNDDNNDGNDDNNDKRNNLNDMSSDDNDNDNENEHNLNNDNGSDDQTEHQTVSKRKRKISGSSESSEDSDDNIPNVKRSKSDNESDNEDEDEVKHSKAKAKDIFGEMSSEEEEEDDNHNEYRKSQSANDEENQSNKDSSDEENLNEREAENDENIEQQTNQINNDNTFIEDEEQQEEEVVPETRIEVEIPRIVADLGKEMHFVKLPNFLSIDTHPYDPQWYEDEIDEDEVLDDEGRARLKLKVENTIRWRNVYDKESDSIVKESNARVVRWSDGSFSLHLGDEIFDIHKLQLMAGDNNHLFVRQGTGLQGQAVFRTKLTFRPFSTESFTHRKLTLSLADRSQKTQKIRVLPNVGKDPEAHRSEMIKKEEDRLKASIRRENKMRRVRERSLIRGPTASYLEPDAEDDDEEEGISISKIKNQYKRGASYNKYQDDVDSGDESKPETKPDTKPANDDDDSDLDIFDKRKSLSEGKKKSAQIVESDDE